MTNISKTTFGGIGPTSTPSYGSSSPSSSGSGAGSTPSSAYVPQLNAYAAQYSTDFSNSASNQLPAYQPAPQDGPGAQVALGARPAASAVQNASSFGDVSSDVFAQACVEALQARQGQNGQAVYSDYLRNIGSVGLRSALDNFVRSHQDADVVAHPGDQNFSEPLRVQARSYYPSSPAAQAQSFKSDLYNQLGQYGVRDAVWPKLQADGLLPNDDGSMPASTNNSGDAQSAFAAMAPDTRQQLRNQIYNLVQGSPYGALWAHMDAWGLMPQGGGGAQPSASNSGYYAGSSGGTTNTNNNYGSGTTANNKYGSGSTTNTNNNYGSGSGSTTNTNNNGGQPTGQYTRSQAQSFSPNITDATRSTLANAAANTQDSWVRGAAGRASDNLGKLQSDQNWLAWANSGLDRANNAGGSAPDDQGNMRPLAYWQSQQQLACGSLQLHWEAQRDLEAQYWFGQSRIDSSSSATYQRYASDPSYTAEGPLPAGFRSAPLPVATGGSGGSGGVTNTNNNFNGAAPSSSSSF